GGRHPRPVVAVARLAGLVRADLLERDAVLPLIALARNLGGHASDRVRSAPVAGLDEEQAVGPEETLVHRHARAVRQSRAGISPEVLDEADDVVPAPAVESGRVLAQFPEDLVHLERGEDGLDQHRRPDRAPGKAELILGCAEDLVPEAGLAVALELRKVEVRT